MLGGAAGSRATQTAAGLGDEGRGTPEGVGTPAADPPGEEEMMGGPPGREHELWARAYACPTCDARFARWHKCLSHMKKQQHLKQNSYTTKEQLRLLLTLDTPNSPLREGSKKMLTNSVVLDAIAARNAPGAGEEHEQGGVKKPKQGIKYECPLCNLLTGRWAKMWEHMGDTGHVARSSYRTQEHLRLLLIRTTEPVYAPGDFHRELLRPAAPTPPPNTRRAPPSPSAAQPFSAAENSQESNAEHVHDDGSSRAFDVTDMPNRGEYVRDQAVGVVWRCCKGPVAQECPVSCKDGHGEWFPIDEDTARMARFTEPIRKVMSKFEQVRHGPKNGVVIKKRQVVHFPQKGPRPGYACPGCGAAFDTWKRVLNHVRFTSLSPTPCLPSKDFKQTEELRLRSWLVSSEWKRMDTRRRGVDTFGWHSDWQADIRPALQQSGTRVAFDEQSSDFRFLV